MLSGVANSFASVTIIRVLSRVMEFFLRVYLIREVLSPEVLAEMVALDLILTTALHVTKNCFKPSYQQMESKDRHQNIVSSMNLMFMGVVATMVSAVVVVFLQWNHKIKVSYVNQSILLYGLCSILEAVKEKYSVQFVLDYQYQKIALIELVSYLPKTAILFVAARTGLFERYGILMFGVGQLVFYGMGLALTFYLTSYKFLLMRPVKVQRDKASQVVYLDSKTKKILKELSYISVLKLLLQQFEKIVLVFKNTIQVSSIYSLVSNLGSIIVRFVFAPLEEIAYNYYARGTEQQCQKTLLSLVKIIVIFSFLCLGFGVRYAQNVLGLLYGEKWVSPESVLAFQFYLLLLSIMGINGTMQAFVMARADEVKTIPKFKYFTLLSTMVYIGCSLVLLNIGLGYIWIYHRAAGLFLGNSINFLIRMVISWNIQIKHHVRLGNFLKSVLPGKAFVVAIISCLLFSYKFKQSNALTDLGMGIVLFGFSILPVLSEYKAQIMGYIIKIRRGSVLKKDTQEVVKEQ